MEVVKEVISETKAVRFEKNGYSDEWHKEAAKRGLPNTKNTPEALKLFLDDNVLAVFAKFNVLTEKELRSKIEIKLENYVKIKEIEYKYALKVVNTLLLPAILQQINSLAKASKNLNKINIKSDIFSKDIETLLALYEDIKKYSAELEVFIDKTHADIFKTANDFAVKGAEILIKLREKVDIAEDLVSDEYWPLASYQKLLNAF